MRQSSRTMIWIVVLLLTSLPLIKAARASRPPDDQEKPFVVPLPEIEESGDVQAEHGRIYIQDKRNVVVYSFEDGRFLGKIGRPGQGPGEFNILRGLTVLPDAIVAYDISKALFFSIEGEYRSQIVPPRQIAGYPFIPVGDHFVGVPLEFQEDGSLGPFMVVVFDSAMEPVKRIIKLPNVLPPPPPPPPKPGTVPASQPETVMIRDYFDYIAYDKKIFVADSSKGFFISIFNEEGDHLYDIIHPVEKQTVTKDYKEWAMKEHRGGKPVWPDYFPAFTAFKIDGGRIYVVTSARQDGLSEVIVMDLKGKILDRSFRLSLQSDLFMPHMFARKFDIEVDRFVWVQYNNATAQYELHIE